MGPYGMGDGDQQCGVPSGHSNDSGAIAGTLVGGLMGFGSATGAVAGGAYGLGIGAAEALETGSIVSALAIGDAAARRHGWLNVRTSGRSRRRGNRWYRLLLSSLVCQRIK